MLFSLIISNAILKTDKQFMTKTNQKQVNFSNSYSFRFPKCILQQLVKKLTNISQILLTRRLHLHNILITASDAKKNFFKELGSLRLCDNDSDQGGKVAHLHFNTYFFNSDNTPGVKSSTQEYQ